MINQLNNIGTLIRRIAGMVLLFTFFTPTLFSQSDPPQQVAEESKEESQILQQGANDSVQISDPTQQDAAGNIQESNPAQPISDSSQESDPPPRASSLRESTPAQGSDARFQMGRPGTNLSGNITADSVKEHKNVDVLDHSPRKALLYSLFIPGLGQAYNQKYYKIPFVYAILGGAGYWIHYNTQGYRAASERYAEDDSSINERYLRAWRRNLELSYITIVGAHALQVLDAYVDANLFYWDVSPDLVLRVEPAVQPSLAPVGLPFNNYGLRCSLTF